MRTEQYVMQYSYGPHTLAIKANGGSVKVEKRVGADWVTGESFDTDGVWRLDLGNSATRFTPAGGAAYVVSK